MNRVTAKREMQHILDTQKTVSVDRLKVIWKGLNFGSLEDENKALRKKIARLKLQKDDGEG